jgi:hypothetical protein
LQQKLIPCLPFPYYVRPRTSLLPQYRTYDLLGPTFFLPPPSPRPQSLRPLFPPTEPDVQFLLPPNLSSSLPDPPLFLSCAIRHARSSTSEPSEVRLEPRLPWLLRSVPLVSSVDSPLAPFPTVVCECADRSPALVYMLSSTSLATLYPSVPYGPHLLSFRPPTCLTRDPRRTCPSVLSFHLSLPMYQRPNSPPRRSERTLPRPPATGRDSRSPSS